MPRHELWIAVAVLVVTIVWTWIDIRYERREIERFLRVGGARLVKFRWRPLLGWMGADRKSKHYEVPFAEHSGRVLRAIFTVTAGIGVMKTSERLVREASSPVTGDR